MAVSANQAKNGELDWDRVISVEDVGNAGHAFTLACIALGDVGRKKE